MSHEENDRVEDKGESEAENDPCEESREDELISGDEREKINSGNEIFHF